MINPCFWKGWSTIVTYTWKEGSVSNQNPGNKGRFISSSFQHKVSYCSTPTLNSPETVRAEDLQHFLTISPLIDDRQHTLDRSADSPKTRIEASVPTRNRFDLLSTPIGHNDDDDDQEDDTDGINDCEYVEGCYLNHISDPDGCEGCMCGKSKPCKTKYCDIHACLHCPTTWAIKIFMG